MKPLPKILLLLGAMGLAGCATMTGPAVSRGEIETAKRLLEVKALKAQHEQLTRINSVGFRLVTVVPEWEQLQAQKQPAEAAHTKDTKPPEPLPYAGWVLDDITDTVARAYALRVFKGVVVAGVIPGGPAARAGLQAGDVLLRVNTQPVASVRAATTQLKKLTPNQSCAVQYERQSMAQETTLTLDALPRRVVFRLVEQDAVNASADVGGVILLTTGMMRFLHSDDELAVVVAHELAHATRGHLLKSFGQELFANLLGGALGGLVEIAAGGGGRATADVAAAMVRAPFAQDLEREADYVGLQYAHLAGFDIRAGAQVWERFAMEKPQSMQAFILSTHPTTPERLVALQKTVEELLGPQATTAQAVTPPTPVVGAAMTRMAPTSGETPTSATPLPPTNAPGITQSFVPAVTPPIPAPATVGTVTLTQEQLNALVEQRAAARTAQRATPPAASAQPPSVEEWLRPPPAGFYSSHPIKEIGLAAEVHAYNVLVHMGARTRNIGDRFPLAQGHVTWYAKLEPKFSWKPPTFRAVWYAPDGTNIHEEFFSFSKIDANLIRSTLTWDPTREDLKGTWRVEVFEEAKTLDRRTFVVE